jgi:hypothetical protein
MDLTLIETIAYQFLSHIATTYNTCIKRLIPAHLLQFGPYGRISDSLGASLKKGKVGIAS